MDFERMIKTKDTYESPLKSANKMSHNKKNMTPSKQPNKMFIASEEIYNSVP